MQGIASDSIVLYLTGRGHTTDTWALEHRLGCWMALQLCHLGDSTTSSSHHCNVVAIGLGKNLQLPSLWGPLHTKYQSVCGGRPFSVSRPKPVLTEKDLRKGSDTQKSMRGFRHLQERWEGMGTLEIGRGHCDPQGSKRI